MRAVTIAPAEGLRADHITAERGAAARATKFTGENQAIPVAGPQKKTNNEAGPRAP